MREGWEIKKFTDCIQKVKNTKKIPRKKFLNEGMFPIVSQEKELINGYWDNSDDVFIVEKPVVIFGDHTKTIKYVDFDFAKGADGIKILLPKNDLNSKFFTYQLHNIKIPDLGYARHYRLLKENEIVIPPLPEQKQIVEILDQAFKAIDKAKANIEKNIVNANELFQSKLNEIFSQKGEGSAEGSDKWEEKEFSQLFKLKSGDGLTSKNMVKGPYPVYGGNGISGYHNDFNFESPEIIIGRVGALCGNVRLINERFWLTDNAFRISEFKEDFDSEFVVFLLNFINLRSYARQAAQPVISNSSLKNVLIRFPKDIDKQIQLRKRIVLLEEQIKSIMQPYSQKLTSLEELKKSILEKAFSGELTAL